MAEVSHTHCVDRYCNKAGKLGPIEAACATWALSHQTNSGCSSHIHDIDLSLCEWALAVPPVVAVY